MQCEVKVVIHFGDEIDDLCMHQEISDRLRARINDIKHVEDVTIGEHDAFAEVLFYSSVFESTKDAFCKIAALMRPLIGKYSKPPKGYELSNDAFGWCFIKHSHEDSHRYETEGEAFAAAWQDAEGDIYP